MQHLSDLARKRTSIRSGIIVAAQVKSTSTFLALTSLANEYISRLQALVPICFTRILWKVGSKGVRVNDRHPILGLRTAVCFVFVWGMSMNACATTSTFTWKEEVLLHDGKKIIVERTDIYDSSMNHEIGQGPPLAEHKTTFTIPSSNQTVTWKSDYRQRSNPDSLQLIALDVLDSVPYVATLAWGCVAYDKWERPNPPYIFFKYVDGWKHISLQEYPENFQINMIVISRKKDKPNIFEANKKFGYVPAEMVAAINKEPGRTKQSYALYREPIDLFGICPEVTGSDGLPVKKEFRLLEAAPDVKK